MENTLSCGVCSQQFTNFVGFTSHMKDHMANKKKVESQKIVTSVASPAAIEKAAKPPPVIIKRQIVVKKPPIHKTRKKRIKKRKKKRKVEEVEGEYKCDFCDKIFKYLPLLNTHLKIHSQERRNDYCVKCNSRFVDSLALQLHKGNCSTLKKPQKLFFQCSACPLNFATEQRSKDHEQLHHAKLRCPNCQQLFLDNNLVSHVRSCKPVLYSGVTDGLQGDNNEASSKIQTFIVSSDVKGLLAQQQRGSNFTVVSNEVMRQLKTQLQGTNVETLYMCKACNHAFKSINQLEQHQLPGGGCIQDPGGGCIQDPGGGCIQDPNHDEEMADGGVIEEVAAGHDDTTTAIVNHQQAKDGEPLYSDAGDNSVILECDTTAAVLGAGEEVAEVVGEEVVLAEDGAFQGVMQVNLQDSPEAQTELTYLTSENAAFVVCLDSGQQHTEENGVSRVVADTVNDNDSIVTVADNSTIVTVADNTSMVTVADVIAAENIVADADASSVDDRERPSDNGLVVQESD
eukprot:TRINITY_DN19889_c0_g1_i12.p1 TRINITY_DN19889_c0_g1~~TRINITY_DN19889_c0_g1_i12.p1  ORF type:complete len:513 (-),score=123.60 TRINITY_DN19889_c0_g1_i12:752-2290(-)